MWSMFIQWNGLHISMKNISIYTSLNDFQHCQKGRYNFDNPLNFLVSIQNIVW